MPALPRYYAGGQPGGWNDDPQESGGDSKAFYAKKKMTDARTDAAWTDRRDSRNRDVDDNILSFTTKKSISLAGTTKNRIKSNPHSLFIFNRFA